MNFLDSVEEVALGDSKNFQEIRITDNVGEVITLLRNGKGWTSHNANPEHIMKKLKSPLNPDRDTGIRVVVLSKRMRYHASCIDNEILITVYSH